MLYSEIIAVSSQIHTKHINTVCRTYHAVNTHRLGYKTSQLMLYSEIIADCSKIHIKPINALCEQNVPRSKHTPSQL
jgi:hypothetical protein